MSSDNQQQPTPLSEEQLRRIRERLEHTRRTALIKPDAGWSDEDWPVPVVTTNYCTDGSALLAEVERLRSVVAELRSEAIDLRLTIQDAYWKWEHGTGLDGEWARQAREALSGEDEEESEGSSNDD